VKVSRERRERGREGTGGEGALVCLASLLRFVWGLTGSDTVQFSRAKDHPMQNLHSYLSLCWIQTN
jgi:hypothetical protein